MTAGLQPYPKMKDSGVEELGWVPAHWEVKKLGQIGRLSKGNGASKEDEVATGLPCIRYGDLYTRHTFFIEHSRACISQQRAKDYTPIRFGDVLFAASGETIEEIGKSAVNLIRGDVYCGGDVILFRPNIETVPSFMGYATGCRPATTQKAQMGRGFTVIHIYGDQLKRLAVPLPPNQEQVAIARFLDYADRRIRRYIRTKQKLIVLLEEQKQAIVFHTVTGRIDARTGQPYLDYKNSEIEWLGRIPEGWNVRRYREPRKSRKRFHAISRQPWVLDKRQTRMANQLGDESGNHNEGRTICVGHRASRMSLASGKGRKRPNRHLRARKDTRQCLRCWKLKPRSISI